VPADCFGSAFAYVALGHLHRPQAAKGNETVRYAGSPIPLSFSEAADRKAVRRLDFIEGRLAAQAALEIPPARRLARISVSRQSLDLELGKFSAPAGELPTWVEVIVEDPVAGENLYDRAREIGRAKGFEVIQVSGKRAAGLAGLADGDTNLENDIPDLLAEPAKVFAHRLATEPALTDAERERLKITFQELLDLHAEQERQGRTNSGVQRSGVRS
jgi:exonuclease SbcD